MMKVCLRSQSPGTFRHASDLGRPLCGSGRMWLQDRMAIYIDYNADLIAKNCTYVPRMLISVVFYFFFFFFSG